MPTSKDHESELQRAGQLVRYAIRDGFRSVLALTRPLTDNEMTEIAAEEAAREAVRFNCHDREMPS